MTEMYGSYSDEDLNEWERMPQNIRVLTSSAFGAWLLRRDKNIKEQEPKKDILDKIRTEMAELIEWHDCPIELDGGNDAWYCEAVNRCIAIIDKYRQEAK